MNSRQIASIILIFPVIALLERFGLKERAQAWIRSIRSATTGRHSDVVFSSTTIHLRTRSTSLGGHPQTVRPLLAPMAEGAALHQW